MKKLFAALLIAFFTLAIITAPRGGQLNPLKDLGGTVVQLIAVLVVIAGLFYSVRWYMKLDGHTYKLARQAWASILFWYSLLATLTGLALMVSVSVAPAIPITVLCSLLCFACWKWRRQLRLAEAKQAIRKATRLPSPI